MKKLLYFYPARSSFIVSDLEILKKRYHVIEFNFNTKSKTFTPLRFIIQFFFILWHIGNGRILFSQFAGYHSFLPSLLAKWFGRKHYIVLHGTECNNFPELRYGFLMRPYLFWFSKKSIAWAYKLLPVSEYLVEQHYTYMDAVYSRQGFRAFYPKVRTPYEVIHNGAFPDMFQLLSTSDRPAKSFISVAGGLEESNRMLVKGLDMVCDLAALLPDCTFAFIGAYNTQALHLPPNIVCLEYRLQDQLAELYNQYNFYLQVSVTEGMPIALIEAMMCGCIPIVSKVGIMPDMIGPHGYVLERKDLSLLEKLVKELLNSNNHPDRNEIRQWAVSRYSMQKRENSLLEILANP